MARLSEQMSKKLENRDKFNESWSAEEVLEALEEIQKLLGMQYFREDKDKNKDKVENIKKFYDKRNKASKIIKQLHDLIDLDRFVPR